MPKPLLLFCDNCGKDVDIMQGKGNVTEEGLFCDVCYNSFVNDEVLEGEKEL